MSPQPCEQVVGFRSRIIHEYAEVDTEIAWTIAQNEVPRLLEKSKALLKESEYGG